MNISYQPKQENSLQFHQIRKFDPDGWYISEVKTIIFKQGNFCVRFSKNIGLPFIWQDVEQLAESYIPLDENDVSLVINLPTACYSK